MASSSPRPAVHSHKDAGCRFLGPNRPSFPSSHTYLVGMPKLFIDNHGVDDSQYAFVDAAGHTIYSSTCTSNGVDGTTNIYQHDSRSGPAAPMRLVASIKWPHNAFRDPVLVLYSDSESEDATKLQLTSHSIRQSLNITTRSHSRAHWRRIPETGKLVLFTGHNREKRLIADECQHAGKRWLQLESKQIHHCSITDIEIVATWIAMTKEVDHPRSVLPFNISHYLLKCFSLSHQV